MYILLQVTFTIHKYIYIYMYICLHLTIVYPKNKIKTCSKLPEIDWVFAGFLVGCKSFKISTQEGGCLSLWDLELKSAFPRERWRERWLGEKLEGIFWKTKSQEQTK